MSKAVLLANILTMFGGPILSNRTKAEPKPKMNLSDDELEKLKTLSGKEKKKYVESLRQKYSA